MQGPSPEMVELFLQEASEHLQFLREYSGILQDPYPLYEDIERLYISAHGVAGTGGTYGYAQFHEVAGKLAHIYQYAMNASISQQATGPLVEFIYEAIAVLESDLLMISAKGEEAMDEIASFKQRYPFAFQVPPPSMDDPTEQPHPPEPEPDELVEAEQQPEPETQTPVVEEPVAEAPVAQATSAAAEPESSAPETFTQEPAWVAEEAAHTEEHAPLESADFVEEVLPEPLLSLNEPLTQETEPLTQEAEPVVQEPEPVAAEAMQAEPLAMENAAAPQAATPEEPAAEILEIPALEAAPPLDDLPAPES
ncbi:MAG: hypothetical protein P4M01_01380, partial [Acidobacteriota bacterium]|nr:hypothetical protein [Acidobacteriota bacterium]